MSRIEVVVVLASIEWKRASRTFFAYRHFTTDKIRCDHT